MAAASKSTEGSVESLDGRRQRADASRRRIALAMLDLARAGEIAPSAEQVAERAGVGRRTVFRLFSDMEGVYREMHAVMTARLTPMFEAPFTGPTWRARIDELIERRGKMFEEMLPVKTAADAHRFHSPFLQIEHKKITKLQRETLLKLLPAGATADADKIEALDLTFSFEAWRRLRHEQKLTPKQAAATWRHMARALLD
ncbi:MAG: TetR family transcriptional regulator [Caulobacterales bacterium]|jgi:AcrR family transcriptional regulator|nr:TetR family transcriptional regulator [Caulobacterales bacterium]